MSWSAGKAAARVISVRNLAGLFSDLFSDQIL